MPPPNNNNNNGPAGDGTAHHNDNDQDSSRPSLPTHDDFLATANDEGLLALSDPRTNARPTELCLICKTEIETTPSGLDSAVVIQRCRHIYHRECIMPWFIENPRSIYGTCPYCRINLFLMPENEHRIRLCPRDAVVDGQEELNNLLSSIDAEILEQLGNLYELAAARLRAPEFQQLLMQAREYKERG